MSCVKFSPARRTQKKANTKPATSPTTPASCAAPPATVPAVSAWTCSFLPDVDIPCPDCRGSRYGKDASKIRCVTKTRRSVHPARNHGHGRAHGAFGLQGLEARLAKDSNVLNSLGLGYLTLGEETPGTFGRRSAALKACERDGQGTERLRVRVRRADHRPAPARRADTAQRVPNAHRQAARPSSLSSTTSTSSAALITFSIWAPAAVKRAVGLSPAALRNRSKTPRTA